MTLNVLVADDDEPMCNLISSLINEYEEFSVVAKTIISTQIIDLVNNYKPDIIFTDINMPNIDGLTIANQLRNDHPEIDIVFVTTHSHFAAEAYNLDAIDYVVKPVDRDKIEKALKKVLRRKGEELGSKKRNDNRKRLQLKTGHTVTFVETDKILFIEKCANRCLIHTSNGKYETVQTLSSLEKQLKDGSFFRCHKSFIINSAWVEKIEPYGDRTYEITFYRYPMKATMRREKFEEFSSISHI